VAYISPAGCRTALATWLQAMDGIVGVGKVHDQRRIIRNEGDIKRLLSVAGKIHGWMISPAASTTTVTDRHPGFKAIGAKGGGQAMTTFQWQIEGMYQIDDAAGSEATFNDLAWAAVLDLNSHGALAIPGVVHQLPADIESFGYIMLANFALLHYCRIGVAFQGKVIG
jgi:hypothetical protein